MEDSLMLASHLSAHRLRAVAIAGLIQLLASAGCWHADSLPADDPGRLTITLRSSAFADGGSIPKAFTCDGSDRSPPLEWSGVPAAARSLALVCDDPDAPLGTILAEGRLVGKYHRGSKQ
jgi:hypothetical protein